MFSAGVGRTGVFIALYYLIETFEHHGKLNVKQLVDTIRYYRPHLVQTAVYFIEMFDDRVLISIFFSRNSMNISIDA